MKTERIGIRITPELKQELERLASAENRTFSNYVETLLIDHVGKGRMKFYDSDREEIK